MRWSIILVVLPELLLLSFTFGPGLVAGAPMVAVRERPVVEMGALATPVGQGFRAPWTHHVSVRGR